MFPFVFSEFKELSFLLLKYRDICSLWPIICRWSLYHVFMLCFSPTVYFVIPQYCGILSYLCYIENLKFPAQTKLLWLFTDSFYHCWEWTTTYTSYSFGSGSKFLSVLLWDIKFTWKVCGNICANERKGWDRSLLRVTYFQGLPSCKASLWWCCLRPGYPEWGFLQGQYLDYAAVEG